MEKFKTKILSKFKKIKTVDRELIVIFIVMAIYIAFITFFTFAKQDMFLTGRYDLGNMDQTVWNTIHGRIFTFTNPDYNLNMSRLSVHADFILILLAPFYLIWEDPKMLLLIQTIVIALGSVFVYLLAKKVLGQKLIPLALAISYLFNPFVQRQNIFEFHAVTFATTFLLACFYYLEKNKYLPFFVFLGLAALTKEHVFAVIGFLGLYIFIVKKKKWGILLSIISFFVFYLLIAKIIPQARSASHFAFAYFDNYGGSLTDIVKTFLTNPSVTIATLIKNDIPSYVKNLFLPVGFLSIFSPLYFVFALPEFVINSLSKEPGWRSYAYHYSAVTIPFVYISAIFGVKKLMKFFPKKGLIILIYICIFIVLSAYLSGPLPGAREADPSMTRAPQNQRLIQAYLNTIPASAVVASTNNLGAHLSHREKNYSLSANFTNADYVLFLFAPMGLEDLKNHDPDIERARSLLKNSEFKLIYKLSNFMVFMKIKN